MIEAIGKFYAGRASSSAVMDLCITLLSMGLNGYKRIVNTRHNLVPQFQSKFHEVATKYGGRLLSCPNNTISFAITLDHLSSTDVLQKVEKLHVSAEKQEIEQTSKIIILEDYASREDDACSTSHHDSSDIDNLQTKSKAISYFGSMLFTRCVSGTRVVPMHETKAICEHTFRGYGSSTDNYPHSYLTAACAIGLPQSEMDEFFIRLDKCFHDYFKKAKNRRSRES